MNEGSLVFYREGGKISPGIVVKFADSKIQLVNASGKKVNTYTEKVEDHFPPVSELDINNNEMIKAFLKDLIKDSDHIKTKFNLGLLHDLVCDEPESSFSSRDLYELTSSKMDVIDYFSFKALIKEDSIYFKEKENVYYPKSKAEVTEALSKIEAAKQAEERKKQEEIDAINYLGEVLKFNKKVEEEGLPKYVLRFLEPVRRFCILRDDFTDTSIKYLLNPLFEFIGKKHIGDLFLWCFNLLVRLNIFSEDENLELQRYNIVKKFKEEKLEELETIPKFPSEAEQKLRKDLSELYTYSIDDSSTRDIDDALSFEEREDVYVVYTHIADASFFIMKDSLLDQEALSRGTTVYLPDGKIAMFPEDLSEGKISLIAGEYRPALTFEFGFDKESLKLISKSIYMSTIKVDRKLSYNETEKMMNEGSDNLSEELLKLNDIALALVNSRIEEDAFIFESEDVHVHLDEARNVVVQKHYQNQRSNIIVREFMILVNSYMGLYCLSNQIPAIYLSQPAPTQPINVNINKEKLKRFELHEIFKSLKKSEIGISPAKHFCIGSTTYSQASSPIRRYHDLIMHRQVKAYMKGETIPYSKEELRTIAATAERTSKETIQVERNTKKYWLLKYLLSRKDEVMDAEVTRIMQNTITLEICETLTMTLIHANIPQNYKLGDIVPVKILSVNPRLGTISVQDTRVHR